ncbi:MULTISPECIES: hypothetical protein [unclassified Bartonella]|uniref:hypothetical protein n=1 Tax=unclassified Bartonella TaxID=2645622 RepID=UPI0035CF9601
MVKTVEERSKNASYERSQVLKVVATFGAGKVCDAAGLFSHKGKDVVQWIYHKLHEMLSFKIVICTEGGSKRNLLNKETNYLQIGSGRKFSFLRRK